MLNEKFIPIKDYEMQYELSNLGRVRSIERFKKNHSKLNLLKSKILIIQKNQKGYCYVRLFKNNKRKVFIIHTHVWDYFGDKLRNSFELQVDHIDNNKSNNKIDNLQLLTNRQNRIKETIGKRQIPLGVYPLPSGNYYSKIQINKKVIYLGCFNNVKEASLTYQKRAITVT